MPSSTHSALSDRARDLYREALVIDMHNDMPSKVLAGYDPDVRHTANESHTDLPRLIESGITAQVFVAWVDAACAFETPGASFTRALAGIDVIRAFVDRHPDALLLAITAADVHRAKREGKVAIFIGVEGGHAIEDSLDKLEELHRRGASYLTLTWNNGNAWAGSSIGTHGTSTGGLTPFGREVIHALNRLGMLVDISHASDATVADVIATSSAPVIASHSSARALADHPRNLADDQLRAIAATGGVVNVNFYSRFIDARFRQAMDEVEAEIETAIRAEHPSDLDPATLDAMIETRRPSAVATIPPTPLSVLIDHIDHIATVAGVDHVGLGSDFDGISATPADMEDVTALPRIAQALLDRGYAEPAITKILGGNMLRVMERVLGGG